MSHDTQQPEQVAQFKTGDYTPLEGLPLAKRGYVDETLRPLARKIQRTVGDIDAHVDEVRDRESGIIGAVKKLVGHDDEKRAVVQGLNATLKLDAALDNLEEHRSTAYPVLAPKQDDATVHVKTIKTSSDEMEVTRPALIPVTETMNAAELQSHNAAHSRAITIAKADAESRMENGEPPLVANVSDSHYSGRLTAPPKSRTV